jgi:hypothetical protein
MFREHLSGKASKHPGEEYFGEWISSLGKNNFGKKYPAKNYASEELSSK